MVDAFQKTIEGEGLRGLYKGLIPDMLKIAPAAGICWYVLSCVLELLTALSAPPSLICQGLLTFSGKV